MAWTPLDEARTSDDTDQSHVDDHNQLHVWGNLAHTSKIIVKDYGAVGDGVSDGLPKRISGAYNNKSIPLKGNS